MNKEKVIKLLKKDVKVFNRWRRLFKINSIDLSNAYLYNANLSNAYLYNAKLSNADLSNANLYNAYLYNSDLSNADLSNAYLYNADLYNAYLYNAKLSNAKLSNANLSNANLLYINGKIIISISGIGSRKGETIYNYTDNQIQCGCYYGSFKEWIKKIKGEYRRDNRYYQEYKRGACYLFWQARYIDNEIKRS